MVRKKIKVGFDFDGVLFYNPVRLLRGPIDIFKQKVLKKPRTSFYVAKSPLSKLIMRAVHFSSFIPNVGIDDFKKLCKNPKYEVHIITARQSFLARDMLTLMKLYHVPFPLKYTHANDDDMQAHEFKTRMLKKLKLDYYIEDNWDIVEYLRMHTDTKIVWIYNRIDKRFIEDKFCAPDPKAAIEML